MSAPEELAVRALRKLKVIGATETAEAEDLELAIQGVRDAHNFFSNQGLLRWTLDDIPEEVDLGYVLMAAFFMAPDFVQPQEASWATGGLGTVQSFVNLPTSGDVYSVEL